MTHVVAFFLQVSGMELAAGHGHVKDSGAVGAAALAMVLFQMSILLLMAWCANFNCAFGLVRAVLHR